MRRLVMTALLVASPATAQTTNTNCTAYGNQVNCTTTTQRPYNPGAALLQGQQFMDNLAQQGRERQAQIDADFARARAAQAQRAARQQTGPSDQDNTIQIVGVYIREGECDIAVQIAAERGMAALADLARQTCKPR